MQNKLDYYVIHRFMIYDLKLSGAKLNTYAIIYGYSKDGCSEFKGTRNYIADFTGQTVRNVQRTLDQLTKEELIIKRKNKENIYYSANLSKLSFVSTSDKMSLCNNGHSDKMSLTQGQNVTTEVTKCHTNNIDYNTSYNLDNKNKIINNNKTRTREKITYNNVYKIDNTILYNGTTEDVANYMLKSIAEISEDINNNEKSYIQVNYIKAINKCDLWIHTSCNANNFEDYKALINSEINRYNLQTKSNFNLVNILKAV